MILDIIGQIFWFGIVTTPLISFLLIRKFNIPIGTKILSGILITLALATFFYLIAMVIVLRDGLGPT